MELHDLHDFVADSQRTIEAEYARIQKRATEDPGTAGDQGEENWATLLRQWLPTCFRVVTKGRILCESGYASPQVDVLVLRPSYPTILLDKKLYLAGESLLHFECKTTLKAAHLSAAVETCAALRSNLPKREGTPFKELVSHIVYGVLAHSHSWKAERSLPLENIESSLVEADSRHVTHPIQCLDFVCVADLATWQISKITYLSPKLPFYSEAMAAIHGPNGSGSSTYICHAIGGDRQETAFSPLGVLLSGLYSRLAWTYVDMRELEEYFRRVNLSGSGVGTPRPWPISIYSESIRDRVFNGALSNGRRFDEWSIGFY